MSFEIPAIFSESSVITCGGDGTHYQLISIIIILNYYQIARLTIALLSNEQSEKFKECMWVVNKVLSQNELVRKKTFNYSSRII